MTDLAPLGAFGGPCDVNSTAEVKESVRKYELELSNLDCRRVTNLAPLGAFIKPRGVNFITKIKDSSAIR